MTNKNEAPEDGYLIRKSGVFYRPDSCGYTRAKAEAGRYSLKDAIDITHPNGPDGPRDNMRYIHESEVLDPRADLSDAKDKRIEELEALAHKLASDPDYTAAYVAGVADQKATIAELEAKLAKAEENKQRLVGILDLALNEPSNEPSALWVPDARATLEELKGTDR